MPELPEVEVIRREIEPLIKNKTFDVPVLYMPSTVDYPSPDEFTTSLPGRTAKNARRKGKYLLIDLNDGILAIHLRMTGSLLYKEESVNHEAAAEESAKTNETIPADQRFLRLAMPFTDGSVLHFSDMRRFGRVWLVENEEQLQTIVLKNVGPDLLNDLCCEEFIELLQKRKRSQLKALLLDQGFAAGMGNIYTDECLFRCGIHPRRQAETLSPADAEQLYRSIQDVLADGIEHGGTTFRDYRNSSGALGDFQSRLAVYGRKDEPCSCGAAIEKIIAAGRGTYYCPRCQAEQTGEEGCD